MAGERWQDEDVRAAVAGDRDAAERLWVANRRWVAAVVLAHMGRHADLDDMLQAVAVRYLEGIGSLAEPRAFKGWLRTIAANEAMADGRKVTRRRGHRLKIAHEASQQASQRRGEHAGAGDGVDPETGEEARRVLDLALELPDGYREPLILRATKQMSYRQIGRVMGLPESTIETRIARGRRMLRELASANTQSDAPASAGRARTRADSPAAEGTGP